MIKRSMKDYLLRKWALEAEVIQEIIQENKEKEITTIILEYLPDQNVIRSKRNNILRKISSKRHIMVIWYKNPFTLHDNEIPFRIKLECKSFVIMCFELLCDLEESSYIRVFYRYIIKLLKWNHTRFIAIHNNYVMIENERLPLNVNNAISLWL